MKEYIATKSFSSPVLGNVEKGATVPCREAVGDSLVEKGVLETKPLKAEGKKETKPRKVAAKSTKAE